MSSFLKENNGSAKLNNDICVDVESVTQVFKFVIDVPSLLSWNYDLRWKCFKTSRIFFWGSEEVFSFLAEKEMI